MLSPVRSQKLWIIDRVIWSILIQLPQISYPIMILTDGILSILHDLNYIELFIEAWIIELFDSIVASFQTLTVITICLKEPNNHRSWS